MEEKEPSDGLLIDFCPTCGGAWLDAGEIERFGAAAAAFKNELEHASKTHLSTPFPCPRCRTKTMDRAWIAKAEVEFKICPDCKGAWIDCKRLLALRVYLKRLVGEAAAAAAAEASESSPPDLMNRQLRRWSFRAFAALSLFLFGRCVVFKPAPRPKAPPPETAMSVSDYERSARTRTSRAESAEAGGRLEEAMDEYKSAAEYYYAAILAAAGSPDGRIQGPRLEIEYAKAGEPIARVAVRLGRLEEAEEIQKVRLAVFERHRLTEEQAAVKKKLAEISTARKAVR
jgi:Zn-finger nucleic acid-binding protein